MKGCRKFSFAAGCRTEVGDSTGPLLCLALPNPFAPVSSGGRPRQKEDGGWGWGSARELTPDSLVVQIWVSPSSAFIGQGQKGNVCIIGQWRRICCLPVGN
eukprot:10709166-Lingulodinium_polyedra.AAC.1